MYISCVLRERLYISYYHDGVQVYDVSDPELPERIAYYDTYEDNNGNGYSGYNGAWGTYPYLPSGCILASDGSYGLNTLELTITPDSDTRMPSNDIIIDNENRGIVFRTPEDEYVRVVVNAISKIEYIDIATPPTDKLEFQNSNLNFVSSTNGIILKNPNNEYFRVFVDNAGSLELDPVVTLPSTAINITDDLYFSHIRGGIKMKSPNGSCFIYTVGDSGIEEVTSIDCD